MSDVRVKPYIRLYSAVERSPRLILMHRIFVFQKVNRKLPLPSSGHIRSFKCRHSLYQVGQAYPHVTTRNVSAFLRRSRFAVRIGPARSAEMVSGKKDTCAVRASSSYWHTKAQFRERPTVQIRPRPSFLSYTSSSCAFDVPLGYPARPRIALSSAP